MGIRSSILLRTKIAFVAMGVFATAIVAKIFHVQTAEGERWLQKAENIGLRYREVQATRGNILSDDGSLLATSLPFYRVAFDPTVASDEVWEASLDSLCHLLANYFGDQSAVEYDSMLTAYRAEGKQYKVISRELINYRDKKELAKWPLFREGRVRGGVIFEKVERRFKPFQELARRTIGFVREDTSQDDNLLGRGLEYSFNDRLAGVSGEALFQKIAGGHWKPLSDGNSVQPENGVDIQTTVDVNLQDFATRQLRASLEDHQANYGCVIVMEVATGEIKAMVNLGRSGDGSYAENYNYAVGSQGVAEPGSTFKLVSMMALLEEASLNVNDTVNTGEGNYEFYEECIMTDARFGGYGNLSVREVFEKSSNIGTSKLVFKHFNDRPERFIGYIEKFGLASPLDFQMKGAGEPFIKHVGDEGWSGCSLPWMSIGYELKLSPLQMLSFYNSVANDGKMLEPIIVKRVMKGGKTLEEFSAKTINPQVCTPRTLATLRSLLEGVVERGTANRIRTEEYAIAGKTGTTKKLIGGQYVKKYYSSFAGYFPADAPKYSCIVVIDEPRGEERYGGEVAAPVFRKIADMLYRKELTAPLSSMPVAKTNELPRFGAGNYADLKRVCGQFGFKTIEQNTQRWVRGQVAGDTVNLVDTYDGGQTGVPNVTGMTLRDAVFLLENKGLQVRFKGKGRVVKQSLRPGRQIGRGYRIYLTLG